MAIVRRGANTFLVRVYLERDVFTKKRKEINTTVHGTLASAKKVEAKLKGQKESENLIKTPQTTVDTLLDHYLDSVRHLQSGSTQYKYRTFLTCYISPNIGHIPLKKINTIIIQELFNLLLDKKKGNDIEQAESRKELSPSTVKVVRNLLKAGFRYAVEQNFIAENPVSRTKLPPVRESKANSLTIEEAIDFVSVKDKFWYGDAFVFQLHTGLRPQELMALVWEDIDFEQGTVRIERACKWIHGKFNGFGPTKSKRSNRIIGLAPEHLALLRLHYEKQQSAIKESASNGFDYGEPKIKEWVIKERSKQAHLYDSARLIFSKPNGRVPSIANPRKEFKAMLQQAGIADGQSNYRWYDLRHTHASILLTTNVPYHEIAERMGHSVAVLLSTYAHVLKSRRNSGATSFAEIIPVTSNQTFPPTENTLIFMLANKDVEATSKTNCLLQALAS